jgi:hypothetical protein
MRHVTGIGQRGKVRQNVLPNFVPGNRIGDGKAVHGGGGPENAGARSSVQAGIPFTQNQPSWAWEDHYNNEYFGAAAPSSTPDLSGIPANNFRHLGDNHGGRQ